jgi:hypothetical protein
MQQNEEMTAVNTPSAEFIQAISEFLDTDPKDLLVELGYYEADPKPATDVA